VSLKRFILTSSNEGDIVIDPFAGSGTTLAVAKRLNRKYIGIEKNPEYHRWAVERVERTPISLIH